MSTADLAFGAAAPDAEANMVRSTSFWDCAEAGMASVPPPTSDIDLPALTRTEPPESSMSPLTPVNVKHESRSRKDHMTSSSFFRPRLYSPLCVGRSVLV